MATDTPEPIQHHLVYEKIVGEKGIWISDVDGSHARLLAPRGNQPSISPDGKLVAYSGECKDWDTSACGTLYLVSTTDAAKPRRLSAGVSGAITWSPDSKRVVGQAGNRLWSIEVESGKTVELADGTFNWGWSVSPDGKRVAFARPKNPHGDFVLGDEIDLFVVDIEGGDEKRITETGDAAEPVWGPTSIAFVKLIPCLTLPPPEGCKNNTWGRHEIWEVQPDGSNLHPIVSPVPKRFQGQGYLGLEPIDWSEDGRVLLGGLSNEWGSSPMAVDPESGEVHEWAENQASEALALSADGRTALVEMIDNVGSYPHSNAVLIAPYDGGKAHLIATGATGASWNR
jgi:dipeptidyl aminopeptidase/acylaminoacyl peptidase